MVLLRLGTISCAAASIYAFSEGSPLGWVQAVLAALGAVAWWTAPEAQAYRAQFRGR